VYFISSFSIRKAEIIEIWKTGKIIPGNTFPLCDGTMAIFVEESYGIKRKI
jgi:hypothetical protein